MNMQSRILGIAALGLVLTACQMPPAPPVEPVEPAGVLGMVMLNERTFEPELAQEGTVDGAAVFAEHVEELPAGFADNPFADEVGICSVTNTAFPVGGPFDPNDPFPPGPTQVYPFTDVGTTVDAGNALAVAVGDTTLASFFQRTVMPPEPGDDIAAPFIWYNLVAQGDDFAGGFGDDVSIAIPGADFPAFDVSMPVAGPVALVAPEPEAGTWPVDADTVYTWDPALGVDDAIVFITIQTFEETFVTCAVQDADGEFTLGDTDFEPGEGFGGFLASIGRVAWDVQTDEDATLMLMTTSQHVYTTTPDEEDEGVAVVGD